MSTIKPRIAHKVIYQGDDIARLAELYRAAESARQMERASREDLRAGDDMPQVAQERQDEYDAFVDEASERAVVIELHSIGRRHFRDLMAAHPPRTVKVTDEGDEGPVEREETHPDDEGYEVNTETFPDALLTYIDIDGDPDIRTIAAPDFPDPSAVQDFLDNEITDGDYPELWQMAYHLNRLPSADPKARRYSSEHRSLDEI